MNSLLSGANGTKVGAPVTFTDGALGPVAGYVATNDATTFAGMPTTADTTFTMAVILKFPGSMPAAGTIYTNSRASSGVELFISGSVLDVVWRGQTNTAFGVAFSPVADTPYFVAVSSSSGLTSTSIVLANLSNGAVFSATLATGPTQSAPNGTHGIGNRGSANNISAARIAAAMYSNKYLPIPALLMWANDPWGFWYPRTRYGAIDLGSVISAGGGFTAKFRRSLSLIGGRVGSRQAA